MPAKAGIHALPPAKESGPTGKAPHHPTRHAGESRHPRLAGIVGSNGREDQASASFLKKRSKKLLITAG
jgi:hypothetical protein